MEGVLLLATIANRWRFVVTDAAAVNGIDVAKVAMFNHRPEGASKMEIPTIGLDLAK